MANITRYNADETTVMVDNVYITGFAESMITGEKSEDYFSESVGAQGDVVVSEINNNLGSVTITLQATSPQRSHLNDLCGSKRFVSVWCSNKKLNERFGGSKAKIKNRPSLERGAEAGEMQYVFTVFDYTVEETTGTDTEE